ncbi:MAG: nucleotide pyrophosphatase/phosphodiesterase family protein [Candidatus Freyarchaeum deiterrae]
MKVYLAVLDGCNVNWIKNSKTPFLSQLSNNGVSTMSCQTVFPSATYTGHASIITGTYPEEHGIVGNLFYDREAKESRNFDFYDPNASIEAATIFEEASSAGLETAAIAEPVTKGAKHIVSKNYIQSFPVLTQNSKVLEESIKLIKKEKPDLIVANYTAVDSIGETYGPNSKETIKIVEDVDKALKKIFEVYHSQGQEVCMIVSADHGMTDGKRQIQLNKLLRQKNLDAITLATHRTSHVYINTPEQKHQIYEFLTETKGIQEVMESERISELKLLHPRSGDLVVTAEKGYELGDMKTEGSHGGITEEEITVPLIISQDGLITASELENASILHIIKAIRRTFEIED